MRNFNLVETAKKFYVKGKEDEIFVAKKIEECCGGKCYPSSREEDIFSHIDIWWDSPKGGKLGIDVKGKKKSQRKDTSFSPIHWIEIKNVNGKDGWAFSKAKYIAFRCINDTIIFVKPSALIKLYYDKVANKPISHTNPKDCFIPYQRDGNQDLLFKVLEDDLKKISHFYIYEKKN